MTHAFDAEIQASDSGGAYVVVPFDIRAAFDGMAYTHRKEYAGWIAEAKKPETRARRIEKAAAMIAEGRPQRG